MMPLCYHKNLQATFKVLTIDKVAKTVKVVKMIVNNGTDYPEEITEVYPLADVEILNYSNQVDDTGRPILEGDVIAFGEGLVCTGIVKHDKSKWCVWYADETVNGKLVGSRPYGFTYAEPKLLHVIESKGNNHDRIKS